MSYYGHRPFICKPICFKPCFCRPFQPYYGYGYGGYGHRGFGFGKCGFTSGIALGLLLSCF